MRSLNIRFGPVTTMTRQIYYKKIRAAREAPEEQYGVEFSTDDETPGGDTLPPPKVIFANYIYAFRDIFNASKLSLF